MKCRFLTLFFLFFASVFPAAASAFDHVAHVAPACAAKNWAECMREAGIDPRTSVSASLAVPDPRSPERLYLHAERKVSRDHLPPYG